MTDRSDGVDSNRPETTGYIYFGNQKIAKLVKRPNQPDQLYFYFNDALGTSLSIYFADNSNPPRQTSSATPQEGMTSLRKDLIFNTYQLDPYGNLEREEEHRYFHTKEFTGKQLDLNFENLLGYLHHRYYEPDSKLFLSTDPPRPKPEEPFSSNPYIYCLNNPLKFVDPDGRSPWDFVDVISFGMSFNDFRHNPTLKNAAYLGLDTLGLAPLVPGIGSVRMAKRGFDVATTFKGGKYKDITLKAGTNLTRAFEIGKTTPLGSFSTRGITASKLTSGMEASKILGLRGTSNAIPNSLIDLRTLNDIPAKIGFIEGGANRSLQIFVDKSYWDSLMPLYDTYRSLPLK